MEQGVNLVDVKVPTTEVAGNRGMSARTGPPTYHHIRGRELAPTVAEQIERNAITQIDVNDARMRAEQLNLGTTQETGEAAIRQARVAAMQDVAIQPRPQATSMSQRFMRDLADN